MRITTLALTASLLMAAPTVFADKAPAKLDISAEEKGKVSYSIGVDIGRNFQAQGIEVDEAQFIQGVQDSLNDKAKYNDDEIRDILTSFQEKLLKQKAEEMQQLAKENKTTGDSFLADNKTKSDVTTTDSGLQYRVLTKGTGPVPSETDTVTTHYRGRLIDGTEFDSSYSRNEPTSFPVNGVIQGWSEALQMMPVGSKWELVIPPELAYGEFGAGTKIGPNETLIFEVELLSIDKQS